MSRSRAGGAEDLNSPVQAGQIPGWQISIVLRARVKGTPAYALPGRDDGGHPHEDAAHVADQFGGIPPGALPHRQAPAGAGRGQQRASVFRGCLQLNGGLHDKESGMSGEFWRIRGAQLAGTDPGFADGLVRGVGAPRHC